MSQSPFSYPYLESEVASGLREGNRIYEMSPQLSGWIEAELEKRVVALKVSEGRPQIGVYLTLREFKHCPVFLLAYPAEDKKTVIEGWHFRMIKNEEVSAGLDLVLDRVPLKRLFHDLQA
jgi:hypothetical protein